jgi:GNAT superfamily N-acetyltransferase
LSEIGELPAGGIKTGIGFSRVLLKTFVKRPCCVVRVGRQGFRAKQINGQARELMQIDSRRLRAAFSCGAADRRAVECGRLKQGMPMADKAGGKQRWAKAGEIEIRFAKSEDAEIMAALNAQLIRDEGHRNSMTIPQLVQRMVGWLQGDYEGVVVEECGAIVGYALFRRESDDVYLRQLFVRTENRRQGIGRRTIQWLVDNAWQAAPRIRIDVLVGNDAGRAFWGSVGFREYCLTMEMEPPGRPDDRQLPPP